MNTLNKGVDKIKAEVDKDVNIIADKTHMKPWMVFGILVLIALVCLGLVLWCVWRFCRKKRPKKDAEKDAKLDEDENALVENEELKDDEVRRYPFMTRLSNLELVKQLLFANG